MPALSAAKLTSLRDEHPHSKTTFLSYVPVIALITARVDDNTIAVGEETITYDLGTETSFLHSLVRAGQTLLVGSEAGADDLGRIRVKGAATGTEIAGTIPVAWNSDVNWADNAYLTVLHTYEVWPKFPRFDISTEDFFKDKTQIYFNENTKLDPIVRMGPGWAGNLGGGGTVVVTLDGSESYTLDPTATISTYSWVMEKNVPAQSPVIAAAGSSVTTVTFDAAGTYWIKLEIVDSNLNNQESWRPFIVHDPDNPPLRIESASSTENYDSGGMSVRLTVRESILTTVVPKRTPVIMWSTNTYQSIIKDISVLDTGSYADREHIDFFGYLTETDTDIGPDKGRVTLTLETVEAKLNLKYEYPVSLIADSTITGTVNEWWKYPSSKLTVSRAVHHLWKYHSTLLEVADVVLQSSDTRIRAAVEEFTQGSLWDRAKRFANEGSIFMRLGCNRFGVIYGEIDLQMLETDALRAAITDTFTLTSEDWKDELAIDPAEHNTVGSAYVTGGQWTGTSFNAFCAIHGEIAYADGSQYKTLHKLMVSSQAQLNQITGRIMAQANNRLKEVGITFAGNWASALTTFPQEWTRITLTGAETGNLRGVKLNNARCVPRRIERTYNEELGMSRTVIYFEAEAFGPDGIFVACPQMPSVPFEPPPPVWQVQSYAMLYVPTTDQGLWIIPATEDEPAQFNVGLSGDDLKFRMMRFHPATSILDITEQHIWACTANGLAKSTDGGQSWTTISKATMGAGASDIILDIAFNPNDSIVNPQDLYVYVVDDSSPPITSIFVSNDYGSTWADFQFTFVA